MLIGRENGIKKAVQRMTRNERRKRRRILNSPVTKKKKKRQKPGTHFKIKSVHIPFTSFIQLF